MSSDEKRPFIYGPDAPVVGSAEDDAILNRVWEQIRKENEEKRRQEVRGRRGRGGLRP